ncbi:FAD-dependent oxidoreductase [Streptomyces sp. NPDC001709]
MVPRTARPDHADRDADVLVVGAGLTGLSAAVFLAWQGHAVTVVERHASALAHPRARSINPRTAELLRQVGIEEAVTRQQGYESQFPSAYMLRAETLAGPETGRTEQRPPAGAREGLRVSPASWSLIDQDRLEGLLRARAEELGADIRFGHEMLSFTQDPDGVTVRLRTGRGAECVLRTAYVIGADGHASRVRNLLGTELRGPGTLGHVVSMVFDADLSGPLRGRHDPARGRFMASCHLGSPAPGTVLFPHGTPDRWVFNTPMFPGRGERIEDFDDERCVAAVRAAVGVAGLSVRLIPQLADGTKVLSYRIGAGVAESFGSGRVLLAGDAAHAMPPTGAFGAGTGIQDAHNLAWKLAAVLAGRAGDDLISTYEAERRPVADFTLGQALLLMRQRGALPEPPSGHRPVPYDAVVFGYRYRSCAVLDETGEAGWDEEAVPPQLLTGRPGTRAPHVAVPGTAEGSSLDWYGREFVLVVADGNGSWATASRALHGRNLVVRVLDEESAAVHGISPEGAVLVRPDGFVAWRCTGARPCPDRELADTLDRVGCGVAP